MLGCGGNPSGMSDTALQSQIQIDPGDWPARMVLAHRKQKAGFDGYALREFLDAFEFHQLSEKDRAALLPLLKGRFDSRLTSRDPQALGDLETLQRLGYSFADVEVSQAYEWAALAALRHSSQQRQSRAASLLSHLGDSPANALKKRVEAIDSLSLEELEELAEWLEKGNAKRRTLALLQLYAEKGGQAAAVLARWRVLYRWWYGNRPLLPLEAANLTVAPPKDSELFLVELKASAGNEGGNASDLATEWDLGPWKASLDRIILAFAKDPAQSRTLAQDFVDKSVYGAHEMAVVSELFFRMGDVAQAHAWAEKLRKLSPEMPSFVLAAALACAANGDIDRALLLTTSAAAMSGDPGAIWAIAAQGFRRSGQDLGAIIASRKALALTAEGLDTLILYELSLAQSHLGRAGDAKATLSALRSRFLPVDGDHFGSFITRHEEQDKPRQHSLLGRIWPLF